MELNVDFTYHRQLMESPPTLPLQAEADVARLRDMIMGFRVTQMLYVAAKLQLADHLVDGPLSAERVAASVGADCASVGRLLRALTSLGILTDAGGHFGLTALGQLLRRDVPNSLNGIAMIYGDEWLWTAYGRMLHSVRTGETAFNQVHGMSRCPVFSGLSTDSADALFMRRAGFPNRLAVEA